VSFAVDTNILLHASDSGSPLHHTALDFLQDRARRPELFCIPWPTLTNYLRIATYTGVFSRPLAPVTARANIDSLLALPNVRALGEGTRFWECYAEVTRGVVVRGNLAQDAHMVAILLEHGVPLLYSTDADFKKFSTLRIRDPFAN
jgi:toxin-antitoxin system PIN domain toxin